MAIITTGNVPKAIGGSERPTSSGETFAAAAAPAPARRKASKLKPHAQHNDGGCAQHSGCERAYP